MNNLQTLLARLLITALITLVSGAFIFAFVIS